MQMGAPVPSTGLTGARITAALREQSVVGAPGTCREVTGIQELWQMEPQPQGSLALLRCQLSHSISLMLSV